MKAFSLAVILSLITGLGFLAGFEEGQRNIVERIEVQYPSRLVAYEGCELKKDNQSYLFPNGTKGKLIIKIKRNGLKEMIFGRDLEEGEREVPEDPR